MKTCRAPGCEKRTEFKTILKLWAVGQAKGQGKPAEITISPVYCKAHKLELSADDFLDDRSWNHLNNGFVMRYKSDADRETAEVKFKRIFQA